MKRGSAAIAILGGLPILFLMAWAFGYATTG